MFEKMKERIIGYLKSGRNSFLSWSSDIHIFKGPMFIILWGDFHYKVRGHHQREILNTLKTGDVLLRKYDHYLGSRLIPGYWSHAAMYVGDDKVIHMLGEGCVEEDILTFMRCDNLEILRCNDMPKVLKAITNCYSYLGREYDYDFDSTESKFLYCSELCWEAYEQPDIEKRIKKNYILPDDLKHIKMFDRIYSARSY